MIVELAQITVAPGQEAAFEAAFADGIQWAAGSPGYLGHELGRSIENPNRFVLRIEWAMLEDHTARFRGSAAFAQWRAAVGPYFSIPPVVEHFRRARRIRIHRTSSPTPRASIAGNNPPNGRWARSRRSI